jgi:ASC-1-like (ASCH) protein
MQNTHSLKLNNVPFGSTKAKLKTLEVRLNDEKRRTIKTGDILEFHRIDGGDVLRAKVLTVRSYQTLKELTTTEEFQKTGGIYKDRADWIQAINSYYPAEEQSRCGFLAIEIAVLEP